MATTEAGTYNKVRMDAKDFFLHLLTIIVFYISIISIITLLFQYINVAIPDPLDWLSPIGLIRWHLATLVVMFPTYLYLSSYLRKEYQRFPQKKQLSIRKWLIYLTLFLASLIVLCDTITLLYYFLNGDLTARFALKVVAILLVALSVLYYYKRDLQQSWGKTNLRFFAIAVSTMVALVIIYGFLLIGSPFKTRLIKLDQQRVTDLTNIQAEIINYWVNKNKLPSSLNDLTNPISGFKAPVDPQNNSAYEYKVLSKESFELCANFYTQSSGILAKVPAPYIQGVQQKPNETWNWEHEKGRACFTRTIDPDLYKKK